MSPLCVQKMEENTTCSVPKRISYPIFKFEKQVRGVIALLILCLQYRRRSFCVVPFVGRSFADDVTATVDMYGRDLADSVTEKARNICKDYGNVRLQYP